MKKIIITLFIVMMTATSSFAADKIGLSFGLDYVSDYQWRGTTFYQGAGALFPFISYDIANSGVVISYIGEYGDNFGKSLYTLSNAYKYQSADFGIAYGIKVPKIMTIDLAVAYYWLYLSKETSTPATDASFMSASVKFTFDVLLSPFVSYTHDFYFATNAYKDLYVQLGIGHDFKVADNVNIGLGLAYGFFHSPSLQPSQPIMMDIDFSAKLSTEIKGVTLYGGLDLIYTPMSEYGVARKYLAFVGKFGVSYSI